MLKETRQKRGRAFVSKEWPHNKCAPGCLQFQRNKVNRAAVCVWAENKTHRDRKGAYWFACTTERNWENQQRLESWNFKIHHVHPQRAAELICEKKHVYIDYIAKLKQTNKNKKKWMENIEGKAVSLSLVIMTKVNGESMLIRAYLYTRSYEYENCERLKRSAIVPQKKEWEKRTHFFFFRFCF